MPPPLPHYASTPNAMQYSGGTGPMLRSSGAGGQNSLGRNPNHNHEQQNDQLKKYGTVGEYKSMNKKILQSDISAGENMRYDKA